MHPPPLPTEIKWSLPQSLAALSHGLDAAKLGKFDEIPWHDILVTFFKLSIKYKISSKLNIQTFMNHPISSHVSEVENCWLTQKGQFCLL